MDKFLDNAALTVNIVAFCLVATAPIWYALLIQKM